MKAFTPNHKLATRLLWGTSLVWCLGISGYLLIKVYYIGLCACALSMVSLWPWLLLTTRRFALQPEEVTVRS